MASRRAGEGPIRFGPPQGSPASVHRDAFSDHFPVSVVVAEGP